MLRKVHAIWWTSAFVREFHKLSHNLKDFIIFVFPQAHFNLESWSHWKPCGKYYWVTPIVRFWEIGIVWVGTTYTTETVTLYWQWLTRLLICVQVSSPATLLLLVTCAMFCCYCLICRPYWHLLILLHNEWAHWSCLTLMHWHPALSTLPITTWCLVS